MHYLIDGYNLLFRLLGDPHPLQKNRQAAIIELNDKIKLLKLKASIVFDGAAYAEDHSTRSHFDRTEIVYTAKKLSADDYILEVIEQSKRPSQNTVVTSDMGLARRARHMGAQVMMIEDFVAWINKKKKKTRSEKPLSKESDSQFNRLLTLFEKRLSEDLRKSKKPFKDEEF
jgi:predicted RNA-binding protein with PIN domain